MSRLESFIRRMSAQRDILDHLVAKLAEVPGPILEFGFGGGRTFDHLRQRFPERRIVVFENVVLDTAFSRPPPEDFIVSDLRETSSSFAGQAALIHADIETGVAEEDAGLAAWLPALVACLLKPGGYAASGAALHDPRLRPCRLPPGIADGRYHLVRRL